MRHRMMRWLVLVLVLALATSGFGGTALAAQEQISNLVLNKNEVSLEVGGTASLTATAVYVSGATENVTVKTEWSTGDAEVATVYAGSISAKKEGKAVITATYMGKTVIVNVTVTKRVRSLIKDKQLIDLRQGQSEQVKLTAYYDDGSTEDVTAKADWNIENGSVATVVNGLVTGHSSGSTTISASFNNQRVTIPVNVEIVKRVDPGQTQLSLLQGDSQTVKLLATYPDGTVEDVTERADWSSEDEAVADVIKGKITGYGPGLTTIKASYGTKSATIKVDVDHAIKIALDQESLFIKKGGTEQLKLTATYADGSTEDITARAEWTSSDPGIVYVIGGKISGNATGEATVTAKYGNKTVSAFVDVDVPRRLELSEDFVSMKTGETKQVTLVATYADGSEEDVTAQAVWTTDNSAVAYVVGGKVSAYKSGEAKLSASYGGKTVTGTVAVDLPTMLVVSSARVNFQIGSSEQLKLQAVYRDGNQEDITDKAEWTTANKEVAEVVRGYVTGVGTGATTITAKYGTRTATVQVSVGVLKSLTADKTTLIMNKNDVHNVVLTAQYTDGTTKDVTTEAVWTSEDVKVAAVEDGKITAMAMGETKIAAEFGGRTASIVVKVDMADKLSASPAFLAFDLGETRAIALTAVDSTGASSNVSQDAEWTSSNPQVATVDKGVVTPVSRGKTVITAKYGGKSVSIAVEIGVVQSINVDQKYISTKRGKSVQLTLTAKLSDGSEKDVTNEAEWKSSNYKIADVTDGLVTTIDAGKANITASFGGKKVTVPVEVDKLKYLKTNEVAVELKKGQTLQVKATATFMDGTDEDVTVPALWKASNIRVADVKDGIIKATGKGRTTVKVTYAKKSTTIVVTVKE